MTHQKDVSKHNGEGTIKLSHTYLRDFHIIRTPIDSILTAPTDTVR